jgi:integrase
MTSLVIEDLRDQLIKRGLATASVLKALHLLSAILKRAAVRGLIPANPVDIVGKPSPPPAAPPRPLTPSTIERIRVAMLQPRTRMVPASAPGKHPRRAYEAHTGSPTERQRNALIVSMLAYGGFRPIEDRNAEWRDLQNDALRVYAMKTSRERYVDLLAALAQDRAEWRLARGGITDGLIISRRRPVEAEDWANWQRRVSARSPLVSPRTAAVPTAWFVCVPTAVGGRGSRVRG